MEKLLMAVEGEKKRFTFLKDAFRQAGLDVKAITVRELTLFTNMSGSKIKNSKLGLSKIKAIYLETPLKLTQFVEPLLDEIERRGIYCQVKKNSYYIGSNELLQLSVLNEYNIKIPRTTILGNVEQIKAVAEKFSYPVLLKLYSKGEKIQSFIANDEKMLASLAERVQADNAIIREYIAGEVDHCAVIGDKVYNLKRMVKEDGSLQPLKKALPSKLSKAEEETAIQAASVCSCDIATVKMCKGFVLKVKPYVNMVVFTKKTGENIFEEVASLFKEKVSGA
ncbi:MAG: hypothetical protein J7J87_01880 [Candidatus Diapherotrites archaeon]|nr:hypothetical protein [Candidatus Diapherotrites archaeon]